MGGGGRAVGRGWAVDEDALADDPFDALVEEEEHHPVQVQRLAHQLTAGPPQDEGGGGWGRERV